MHAYRVRNQRATVGGFCAEPMTTQGEQWRIECALPNSRSGLSTARVIACFNFTNPTMRHSLLRHSRSTVGADRDGSGIQALYARCSAPLARLTATNANPQPVSESIGATLGIPGAPQLLDQPRRLNRRGRSAIAINETRRRRRPPNDDPGGDRISSLHLLALRRSAGGIWPTRRWCCGQGRSRTWSRKSLLNAVPEALRITAPLDCGGGRAADLLR